MVLNFDTSAVGAKRRLAFGLDDRVRIATPLGMRAVRDLRVGERVVTRERGTVEIRGLVRQCTTAAELAADPRQAPVVIERGALGFGLPMRDLYVAPAQTVVFFDGTSGGDRCLRAADLVGRPGILRVPPFEPFTRVELRFDMPDFVLAEACWTGPDTLEEVRSNAPSPFPAPRRRSGAFQQTR